MPGFGNDAENEILDLVASGVAYTKGPAVRVGLHTGDPGETGAANEVVNAGGSTYARQVVAWTAAASGSVSPTTNVDFNNMPACTVTHFSTWTAAGEFRGSGQVTNVALLLGQTYRLSSSTVWTLE